MGARGRPGAAAPARRRRPGDASGAGRLVAGRGARRRAGHRLRVPARRRRPGPARPPLGVAAGRGARSQPALRPRRVRLVRRRLDRPATTRQRAVRAAHRHVHPRGHVRRGDRQAGPPGRPRCRHDRAAAGERVQRRVQLGLRRCLLVRPARAVRRSGRPETVRRRRPRQGPGGDPRRRLQPFRALRGLRAAVRAVPHRAEQHLGPHGQPGRPATPTGCAATSPTAC